MRLTFLALVAAMGVASAGCTALAQGQTPAAHASPAAATQQNAPQLHAAMRGLWHGHIETTRSYAQAVHAGDTAAATQAEAQVIDNAKQIADAVAGFYGQDAGAGTLELLGGHWGGVKALTHAAKQGDAAAEDKAMDDLVANAGQIADFFSGANPENWARQDLLSALIGHAGGHKQQVDAMMANAPAAEQADLWTQMQQHMDMIADVLSDGLARQFPDKVS